MARYKHRDPLRVVGDAILRELQAEPYVERNRDDDQPAVPDRYDSTVSAQSRRQLVEIG
jgi:hypothetical protein